MKKITVEVPDNYEWNEDKHRFDIKEKEFEYQYINKLEVGDVVSTSFNESAKLISKNGKPTCPFIFLIQRYDNGFDDTFAVSDSGKGWGFNEKYYIINDKK